MGKLRHAFTLTDKDKKFVIRILVILLVSLIAYKMGFDIGYAETMVDLI